jgi:UDP:flavonoid glycosyltransferase YjiC (YdhE family)
VVHHAGAGTTHAAAAAAIPQVAVPHVGDQLYWADRIRRLGVGPEPLPYPRLEATALGRLIRQAADEAFAPAVRRLSVAVREDDGTGRAVALLEAAARA